MLLCSPDKNVTIAKKCSVFPVEFVVRGFVTGSTDTSLWAVYSKGVCNYCGNALPNGLLKNQRLPANILTPTAKAADHDVPITPQQIVERGLMTQDEYDEVSTKALSLFEYEQVLPDAPQELITELAWRYIFLYETINNREFDIIDAGADIRSNLGQRCVMPSFFTMTMISPLLILSFLILFTVRGYYY